MVQKSFYNSKITDAELERIRQAEEEDALEILEDKKAKIQKRINAHKKRHGIISEEETKQRIQQAHNKRYNNNISIEEQIKKNEEQAKLDREELAELDKKDEIAKLEEEKVYDAEHKTEIDNVMKAELLKATLSDYVQGFKIKPTKYNQFHVVLFLEKANALVQSFLVSQLKTLHGLKANLIINVAFKKYDHKREKMIYIRKSFITKASTVLNEPDTENYVNDHIDDLNERIDDWLAVGSGFRMSTVVYLQCDVIKYDPIKGSSFIELPLKFKNKKAIINVKNDDNQCFKWAILSALHPVDKDAQLVSKYTQYNDELDFTGLSFPFEADKISKFEKLNDICINLFVYEDVNEVIYSTVPLNYKLKETSKYYMKLGNKYTEVDYSKAVKQHEDPKTSEDADEDACDLETALIRTSKYIYQIDNTPKKKLYTRHLSKHVSDKKVNLLLITEGERSHYVWIKHFSRFMASSHGHTMYYCFNCLHGYQTDAKLQDHQRSGCLDNDSVKTILPAKDKAFIKFNNFKNQMEVPFHIIADFECSTAKLDVDIEHKDVVDDDESWTEKYQHHEPNSYAYKVVSIIPEYNSELQIYRGPDASTKFLKALDKEKIKILKTIKDVIKSLKKMIITHQQEQDFKSAKLCHICDKDLNDDRVRDHCHFTGLYRGPAHEKCNLNLSIKKNTRKQIPVIFHNLKGYDSHLIVKALDKQYKHITCLATNSEKYMTFSVGNLKFIDSCSFLNASLAKLVDNIPKDDLYKSFPNLTSHFNNCSIQQLELLCQKGCYPYDFADNVDVFNLKYLPAKQDFHSKLIDEDISDDDYAHAQNVWNAFQCKTFGDYHDLYLKTDVLLLCDVIKNFRKISMRDYKIDPLHYISLPSFAWDCALKKTDQKIELFDASQQDMYLFTEKDIRGGISMMMNRYAKANNKCLTDYDKSVASSFLMYLDANNLYGWAMSQCLPTGGYKWIDATIFTKKRILQMKDDAKNGFMLNVNIRYPKHLHDLHNDYPLAPQSMVITNDMISPYSKQLKQTLQGTESKIKKLVLNLNDKTNITLHYRTLKLYLQLGMELVSVNKVLQFSQSPWLKPYIDFNTSQRALTKNEFEKDFYKLMNNSVFGKTMESVRNRINFELVTDTDRLKKLTAKPTYKHTKKFTDNLVGIELYKRTVTLDKPISIGFSILELSKVLMYDFHYNTIKKKYGNNARLLMSDTDSLFYEIKTDDMYEDMKEFKNQMDFSDYPQDHSLFSVENKKVIGKFKDETHSDQVLEFCGLKPKLYSYKTSSKETKRAKGVKTYVVKNEITHDMYKNCLFNDTHVEYCKMNSIRSRSHEIYSITMNKVSLSSYDDKSYYIDAFTSLRYGHYSIPKQ